MRCIHDDRPAVLASPALCKEHLIAHVEDTVARTIKEYDLFTKQDRIAVAVSGGKDSLSLLYILKKLGYDVTGLAVDEGISPYRDTTLEDLRQFCTALAIPYRIVSFAETGATRLDQAPIEGSRCTYCGTIRRSLLNQHAAGFDILATGHNADDEAQAVLMNLCKAQTRLLFRIGPKASHQQGFVQKVKPLFFLTEKEIAAYAFLQGFKDRFVECPFASLSYRAVVRDLLNAQPDARTLKLRILNRAVRSREKKPAEIPVRHRCLRCGSPTLRAELCKACALAGGAQH